MSFTFGVSPKEPNGSRRPRIFSFSLSTKRQRVLPPHHSLLTSPDKVTDFLLSLRVSGWHPKGLLVAHLHEHKAAVNRIRVSDEHSIFATASNDGTVKVWDSQKMEGKTTTTR